MNDQTMTGFAEPAIDISSGQGYGLLVKLAVAFGLAALADWLFYDERLGVSVGVFALALVCSALAANPISHDRRRISTACVVLVAGLIPVIEDLDWISFILLVLALGMSVAIMTRPDLSGLRNRLSALRDLLLIGPFKLVRDVANGFHGPALMTGVAIWFVPLAASLVFLALFAIANPLIEQWIDLAKPDNLVSHLSTVRLWFWIAALSIVWPFVHVTWWRKAPRATALPQDAPSSSPHPFFGPATILRSLILFNLLFAIQTGLDVAYLWGNATLPADLTYAAYAHRGAYPLIVTALLAAGFVLVAVRPAETTQPTKTIRALVYIWIAQNVVLVASSIFRLTLYVETYLLTYWRIAAFVWMLLVAVGLVLITARIALGHSNEWLVRMNLATLVGALYICSLTNFAAIIADYNVAHSQESGGRGVRLDSCYLANLGPQALPAIEKAIQMGKFGWNLISDHDRLLETQRQDMASWRSWSFRSWRLQRFLDADAKKLG